MERSPFQVRAADGMRVTCELYAEPPRDAALIICPGFFQSKNTPTFQRLASALATSWDVVCMDFRGHGNSSGLFTFSACEGADLEAVVQWAHARYRAVGILGFSLGAATALVAAQRCVKPVASLILVSAPTAFEAIECRWWTLDAVRTGWRGMERGAGCRVGNPFLKKPRPIDVIAQRSGTPVLLIHGTHDPIISHWHSERLADASAAPTRVHLIPGGGHAQELFRRTPEQFLPPIQDWCLSTLDTQAPPQAPLTHTWGYRRLHAQASLYTQQWTGVSSQTPLVLVHGGGEHSGRYAELARRLVQAGYTVEALDLPGHGRSPGVRGHIQQFEEYLTVLAAVIEQCAQRCAGKRPILLGHSLGGLISTYYAVRYPHTICGVVLSSPLWGLALPVPWWKRWLAYGLSPLWPSLTVNRPRIGGEVLSHDPEAVTRYERDPLIHHKASLRFYTELTARFRALPQILPQLKVPILVLRAGADRVVSPEVTARYFSFLGAPTKQLITYDGYYHELFNEAGRETVFHDLLAWLRKHGDGSDYRIGLCT